MNLIRKFVQGRVRLSERMLDCALFALWSGKEDSAMGKYDRLGNDQARRGNSGRHRHPGLMF